MRRRILQLLSSLAVLGLAAGGTLLWRGRPWRVVASVNGTALQAHELRERAAALGGDERRAVKLWIVKQVLLAEALARGIALTAEDLQTSRTLGEARLKEMGLAANDFDRTCPVPPDRRPRDDREGALVNGLLAREVGDRIAVSASEVDALLAGRAGTGKDGKPLSRRAAEDILRARHYAGAFRKFFMELVRKYEIRSGDFPEFESAEGFGPLSARSVAKESE